MTSKSLLIVLALIILSSFTFTKRAPKRRLGMFRRLDNATDTNDTEVVAPVVEEAKTTTTEVVKTEEVVGDEKVDTTTTTTTVTTPTETEVIQTTDTVTTPEEKSDAQRANEKRMQQIKDIGIPVLVVLGVIILLFCVFRLIFRKPVNDESKPLIK